MNIWAPAMTRAELARAGEVLEGTCEGGGYKSACPQVVAVTRQLLAEVMRLRRIAPPEEHDRRLADVEQALALRQFAAGELALTRYRELAPSPAHEPAYRMLREQFTKLSMELENEQAKRDTAAKRELNPPAGQVNGCAQAAPPQPTRRGW